MMMLSDACDGEEKMMKMMVIIIFTLTTITRNNPSPSPDKKEFRPLGFDSNSLKRNKRSVSTR